MWQDCGIMNNLNFLKLIFFVVVVVSTLWEIFSKLTMQDIIITIIVI